MNTHNVTNIIPTLDESGRLVAIAFTAVATNDDGKSASEDFDLSGAFPLPAAGYVQVKTPDGDTVASEILNAYTSGEITALCMAIANERCIFTHLDSAVLSLMTPIYSPPIISTAPALTGPQQRAVWIEQIDTQVAYVTGKFTRFQIEYEQREKAATIYKGAGYTGDPTTWITRFADNIGISYKAAADLILMQSAQLRGALEQLGGLRMDKYKVQNAVTLDDAKVELDKILAAVGQIERGLA